MNEIRGLLRKLNEAQLQIYYCFSRLSIFRDLCSILVIMASALSASTNPPVAAILSLSGNFSAGKEMKKFPKKIFHTVTELCRFTWPDFYFF